MPWCITGPILTMEQAVRNYWSKLEIGGEEAAALFHPSGFFQVGGEKSVGREALAAKLGPSSDAEDCEIVVKSWSFNEAARTCTCEIECGGLAMCDVFQFDASSFLIVSLHVYR